MRNCSSRVAVIGLGSFYPLGEQAALNKKTGVLDPYQPVLFVTGCLDTDPRDRASRRARCLVITLDEGRYSTAALTGEDCAFLRRL